MTLAALIGKAHRHVRRSAASGRRVRGATAVEFALVAPIFLFLVVGMVDMSRAMWIKATMQFAADQAARSYMVDNTLTTAEVAALAETACTGAGVSSSICSGAFSASETTSGSVDVMEVTATYDFQVLSDFFTYRGESLVPFTNVTLTAKSSTPKNS